MSEYSHIKLPLYSFFEALRKKGSQLGMDEYFSFVEALSKGFGLKGGEDVYRTCKLLWFNPGDSAIQFRELFMQYWEEEQEGLLAYIEEDKEEEEEEIIEEVSNMGLETELEDKRESSKAQLRADYDVDAEDEKDLEGFPPIFEPLQSQESVSSESLPTPRKLQISLDSSLVDAAKSSISPQEIEEVLAQYRFLEQPFSSKTDLRKVALSWRHLWKASGVKNSSTVNIQATILALARNGGRLRDIVYHQEAEYEAELMILLDDSKSMVAFKEQAEQMVKIIAKEIDAKPEQYYFSDLSLHSYFKNRSHTEAMKVRDLKSKYFHKRIPVLIISDGGAARGNYSKENIIKVYQGIEEIRDFASNIAWLNPMSRSRWNSPKPSSAWYIDEHVIPMFDFSNADVQAAVNVLRGKSVRR